MKLFLFDIDGTLVTKPDRLKHSSHGIAFRYAFKRIFNLDLSLDSINYHGMTDRQIIYEVLDSSGIPRNITEEKMDGIQASIIQYYMENAEKDEVIPLKGVKQLLDRMQENNIPTGLLTGNIEAVAYRKLKLADLDYYFKYGGFGGETAERHELVNIASKKAGEHTGINFEDRIYLIGDTPRDIKAAKLAGVKSIGVATGIYNISQLKNAGADYLFENLADIEGFLSINQD